MGEELITGSMVGTTGTHGARGIAGRVGSSIINRTLFCGSDNNRWSGAGVHGGGSSVSADIAADIAVGGVPGSSFLVDGVSPSRRCRNAVCCRSRLAGRGGHMVRPRRSRQYVHVSSIERSVTYARGHGGPGRLKCGSPVGRVTMVAVRHGDHVRW